MYLADKREYHSDMTDLPYCMLRGVEVSPDVWVCDSDRLIHSGIVEGSVCRNHCPVVNKPRLKPQGLGDTVHKITHAMGLDEVMKLLGGGCGCKDRKDKLNKRFAYNQIEVVETDGVCEDGWRVSKYTGDVVRNLMMHIYPIRAHQFWRWNVEQILKRLDIFNGVRAVAIVQDDQTDDAQQVIDAFGNHRIDHWIVEPNKAWLREVGTWHKLMTACHSCDPNVITFTCHAKGVRGGRSYDDPKPEDATTQWTTCMYESCLDGHKIAEKLLEHNTFAGSFKRRMVIGEGKFRCGWHYAGTFYWFRNAKLMSIPNWSQIEQVWYGTETYPGTKVGWGQAGGIFGDNVGSLYDPSEWDRIRPRWEEWKSTHLSKS